MLQDISPHHLDISFESGIAAVPQPHDLVTAWQGNALLLLCDSTELVIPEVALCQSADWDLTALRYLFTIDDQRVFYLDLERTTTSPLPNCTFQNSANLRGKNPQYLSFAALLSAHLHRWYRAHRYCGHCGKEFQHSATERALVCPNCGLIEYPRISPAVIIAVTDGDRLLLSRYADRPYRRWALLAGYCEAGETLEDTVRREVQEEVGLQVCNLRYYKSQPWPVSDSLLMGFYCDVEGNPQPHPDQKELAEAVWFHRADLPVEDPNQISLTQEMILAFRESRNP